MTDTAQIISPQTTVLRLGETICKHSRASCPDPFEHRKHVDTAPLLQSIENLTKDIQAHISIGPRTFPFRFYLNHRNKTPPNNCSVQILALIAYTDFCEGHGSETAESVSWKMSPLLSADDIEGRSIARRFLAQLIHKGAVVFKDTAIHLCKPLNEWFTDGDPLTKPRLNEEYVRHILAQHKAANGEPNQSTVDFTKYIKGIPVLTPAELDKQLDGLGYVGQAEARKVVCLSVYRHVRRLKNLFVRGIKAEELPTRENLLLMGMTGCGKTYLMTLLLQQIKIPHVVVDLCGFTEAGYVGDETPTILTRLIHAANGNLPIAQTGVCMLDEFDKIAGVGGNRARFGGEGSTKDVSGLGVQRELLKMLEGATLEVPVSLAARREQRTSFRTQNVLFVGCGAFSGFDEMLRPKIAIGFEDESVMGAMTTSTHSTNDPTASDFHRYGIQPELFGRFGCVVRFDDLSRDQLKRILEDTAVERFRRELKLEGIGLEIDAAVPDLLVDRCMERETGARGLSAGLTGALNVACYEAYSTPVRNRRIRLFVEDGEIQWAIEKARSRRQAHSNEK